MDLLEGAVLRFISSDFVQSGLSIRRSSADRLDRFRPASSPFGGFDMAKKILIPVDATPAASNAFDAVHAMLPEEAQIVFVSVVTPDGNSARSRARAGLVKCLMVYRTRRITCDMELVEAESTAAGIASVVGKSGIDEILCIEGHGADDPSGLIAELGNLVDIPIKSTAEKREAAVVG
jgi:hypothetical protein